MDWLKELLKKLGVAESEVDKIDTEVAKELPKHFVPKTQYNDVVDARKKAEKEVSDRDKQLEDLKKSSGDAESLKQQIEKLQGENKTAKEKYEAEVKDLRLNTALKLALAGKAHDPDIVAGLIDKTKIELDDAGNVKAGLDDQLKGLQKDKAFLFVPEGNDKGSSFQFRGAKPPEGGNPSGGGGGKDDAAEFGKRIADFAKQNAATADAQKSYFGG
ncbi:phage scaffolding protein [Cohnella algarum]|uniref:phage scaffolding protein n=1 Tax=Cohnella algarum TaxID=2044859 RepID=UPI00196777AF|nr:phage scaffolding protein [Cohnella algarum]MBN2980126.1 phage scaffolding protein [Cohnella algarum]